jgi:hypothetical protein
MVDPSSASSLLSRSSNNIGNVGDDVKRSKMLLITVVMGSMESQFKVRPSTKVCDIFYMMCKAFRYTPLSTESFKLSFNDYELHSSCQDTLELLGIIEDYIVIVDKVVSDNTPTCVGSTGYNNITSNSNKRMKATPRTGLITNKPPDPASMEIPLLSTSDGGTSHSSIAPRPSCGHEIEVNVQQGQELGIHIKNSNDKNGLTIHYIEDGSQLANYVNVGDCITKVNGTDVRHMSAAKVIDMLRSLENDERKLHIVTKIDDVDNDSDEEENVDQHNDLCDVCSKGGEVLCCDTCSLVFHLECLGLSSVPGGKWLCHYCVDDGMDLSSSNEAGEDLSTSNDDVGSDYKILSDEDVSDEDVSVCSDSDDTFDDEVDVELLRVTKRAPTPARNNGRGQVGHGMSTTSNIDHYSSTIITNANTNDNYATSSTIPNGAPWSTTPIGELKDDDSSSDDSSTDAILNRNTFNKNPQVYKNDEPVVTKSIPPIDSVMALTSTPTPTSVSVTRPVKSTTSTTTSVSAPTVDTATRRQSSFQSLEDKSMEEMLTYFQQINDISKWPIGKCNGDGCNMYNFVHRVSGSYPLKRRIHLIGKKGEQTTCGTVTEVEINEALIKKVVNKYNQQLSGIIKDSRYFHEDGSVSLCTIFQSLIIVTNLKHVYHF